MEIRIELVIATEIAQKERRDTPDVRAGVSRPAKICQPGPKNDFLSARTPWYIY